MINAILASFPRFYVALVIKRLLYIEIWMLRNKEKKGTGGVERLEWATTNFRFSVAIEIFGFLLRQ